MEVLGRGMTWVSQSIPSGMFCSSWGGLSPARLRGRRAGSLRKDVVSQQVYVHCLLMAWGQGHATRSCFYSHATARYAGCPGAQAPHECVRGRTHFPDPPGRTKSTHCGLDAASYSMAAGGIATGPSSLMLQMFWEGPWSHLGDISGWHHVGLVVESGDP